MKRVIHSKDTDDLLTSKDQGKNLSDSEVDKKLDPGNISDDGDRSSVTSLSSIDVYETGLPRKSQLPKKSSIEVIRDWYYCSLLVCFLGIIGCYSGYAYLQESL